MKNQEIIEGFNRKQNELLEAQEINKDLEQMLLQSTHQGVINFMLEGIDRNNFSVMMTPKSLVLVPNNIKLPDTVPMLCVHTDTVPAIPTQLVKEGNKVRSAKGGLGADDRAGCYIIKKMLSTFNGDLQDFPYIIGIFDEEEVGGVGSSEFINSNVSTVVDQMTSCYIGLDRKGHKELALYNLESEEFLEDLGGLLDLGYTFELGSFTDASNIGDAFSKCVFNISVGYYNEHTSLEHLMINEMMDTLQVMKALPTIAPKLWTEVYEADAYDYYTTAEEEYYSYYKGQVYMDYEELGYSKMSCEICGSTHELYKSNTGNIICDDCIDRMEDL